MLARIAAEEKPLKGIIHTAMVLEDRLLVDLDHDTLDRVLWPKLLGGWNLHQETLGLDLDQFVLFSSLSSVFGHAGQANYAAANAALDGLAHHRRGLGLPATVINWGHLGEVGYLSRRDELAARLERQGVLSFTVQQAMDCLAHALTSLETQLSVLRMDWTLWRGLGITDNVPPKFAHLLRSATTSTSGETPTTISPEALRAAAPAERRRLVEATVRAKTASLLGTDPESLEADRPLLELEGLHPQVEHVAAGDIDGQQVRAELDRQSDRRQSADGRGLAGRRRHRSDRTDLSGAWGRSCRNA